MTQCDAGCCSVLQFLVCRSVLQCASRNVDGRSRDDIALMAQVRCSVLHCVAVRCCVLQCVAGCCSVLQNAV